MNSIAYISIDAFQTATQIIKAAESPEMALVMAIEDTKRPDVIQCMLSMPENAPKSYCLDGTALIAAVKTGDETLLCVLLENIPKIMTTAMENELSQLQDGFTWSRRIALRMDRKDMCDMINEAHPLILDAITAEPVKFADTRRKYIKELFHAKFEYNRNFFNCSTKDD